MPETPLFNEIAALHTERQNPRTTGIDLAGAREILEAINDEDMLVAAAVREEIEHISAAVEIVTEAFRKGGRLLYFGAGTSGRLGIVDAAECPPTFGTDPKMVQGVIAGGREAVFRAQEGAEDSPENGKINVEELGVTDKDVVCGIAASGRTPFVKGALAQAKYMGAKTILICTVPREDAARMGATADIIISPDVGPEVIMGSTRMKSGTAQKLILNMISTAAMIRSGKTLGNVMVDLQLTNEKLKERAKRIIMMLCEVDFDSAERILADAGGHVKTALVMHMANLGREDALRLLEESGGFVKTAIHKALSV